MEQETPQDVQPQLIFCITIPLFEAQEASLEEEVEWLLESEDKDAFCGIVSFIHDKKASPQNSQLYGQLNKT